MREWKVTDGYKVKADELSWEELKNATENVIEEKRKSHRIVVLDGYGLNPGDLSWEGIERMGEFTVYDRTSVDEIVSRAALADIVLTNKTPLSATTLEQLPHLRYIGVLATGYNIVDVEAAKNRGIAVTNIQQRVGRSNGICSSAQHSQRRCRPFTMCEIGRMGGL